MFKIINKQNKNFFRVYTLSLGSDNQLFPSQPFFLIVTPFYLSKQCLAPAWCPVAHVSPWEILSSENVSSLMNWVSCGTYLPKADSHHTRRFFMLTQKALQFSMKTYLICDSPLLIEISAAQLCSVTKITVLMCEQKLYT